MGALPQSDEGEFNEFYNRVLTFSGVGAAPTAPIYGAMLEAWRGRAGLGMRSLVDGTVAKVKAIMAAQ